MHEFAHAIVYAQGWKPLHTNFWLVLLSALVSKSLEPECPWMLKLKSMWPSETVNVPRYTKMEQKLNDLVYEATNGQFGESPENKSTSN